MEMSTDSHSVPMLPIALSDLINRSLCQVFPYEDAKIDIHYDLAHEHQILGDDIKLQRVLVNIIDNARQAMNGEGEIWIKSREDSQQRLTLSIRNSGSFIQQADLRRIFEPFFTKGKRNGTGLGLAICKKIIDSHGGYIECTSSMDEGTTFSITLHTSEIRERLETQHLPRSSREIRRQFLDSMHSA